MRVAPPCEIQLRYFGAWRGAVLALAAASIASLAAWSWTAPQAEALPVRAALVLAASAVVAFGARLWRAVPGRLTWNGRHWHFEPSASMPRAGCDGGVAVALDLGSFLLLRFLPSSDRRVQWLPVQRRGIEGDWHALRCAVYAPRPPGEASIAGPTAP